MTLCWGEGHGSAIHDHANAHCFMKVLEGSYYFFFQRLFSENFFIKLLFFSFFFHQKGTLSEVRFAWPEESNTDPTPKDIHEHEQEHDQSALKEIKRTEIFKNDVAYING